jgi:hypothetical protein
MIEYTVKVDHVSTRWFLNGVLHREDGPAIEEGDGTKYWYLNGKLHREDGPAIEYANGIKRWFLNNEELTLEQFNTRTKAKELTVVEIEQLLGYKIKVIGNA